MSVLTVCAFVLFDFEVKQNNNWLCLKEDKEQWLEKGKVINIY